MARNAEEKLLPFNLLALRKFFTYRLLNEAAFKDVFQPLRRGVVVQNSHGSLKDIPSSECILCQDLYGPTDRLLLPELLLVPAPRLRIYIA